MLPCSASSCNFPSYLLPCSASSCNFPSYLLPCSASSCGFWCKEREMEEFQDFLPTMAEKLGEKGFMAELCNGFRLLSDPRTDLITFDSLKKNSALLGLHSMTDSELRAMLQEGDLDGDGALNQHEFCLLMIRMSPSFMEEAEKWLHTALIGELEEFVQNYKN